MIPAHIRAGAGIVACHEAGTPPLLKIRTALVLFSGVAATTMIASNGAETSADKPCCRLSIWSIALAATLSCRERSPSATVHSYASRVAVGECRVVGIKN